MQEFIFKSFDEDELVSEVKSAIDFNKDVTYALLLHPKLLTYFINNFGNQIENMVASPFYEGTQKNLKNWAFVDWRQKKSPKYQQFANGVEEYLETPITMFHCLGYVHGQMLYKALQNCVGSEDDWQSVMKIWRDFEDETILGIPSKNSNSPTLNFPISLFQGINYTDNMTPQEVVTEYQFIEEDAEDMKLKRNAYTSPYLFF